MNEQQHDLLDRFADAARDLLERANDRMDGLSREVAHFLRVHAAQGVIDNGGYRLFFESDWDDRPPYQVFVDAYAAMGCESQSHDLARVADTFGFAEPHASPKLRNAFIGEHYDEDEGSVILWGDALCGDESVWSALLAYAEQHAAQFDPNLDPNLDIDG
ncbi:MAG: hypothetical protein AAF726_13260 [Planctomycetota bacterium]